MDKQQIQEEVKAFEADVETDLTAYLRHKGVLDERVPVCPDVEERWSMIAREYLPDGAREFASYPVVSLGWMMFIGMAMAWYWDKDWQTYSAKEDIYATLRDVRGYDNLDEVILEQVLGYGPEEAERVSALVADCASRVLGILNRRRIEPGTEAALGCYIAALHRLYLAGMAVELNALGYHMTAV